MKFRVYYANGTTYEGDITKAPPREVVCIVTEDGEPNGALRVGRRVIHGYDFYPYSDGLGFHPTNKYSDLLWHLQKGMGEGGVRAVLTGIWVGQKTFRAIMDRAETDGGFPRKSASELTEDGGTG